MTDGCRRDSRRMLLVPGAGSADDGNDAAADDAHISAGGDDY